MTEREKAEAGLLFNNNFDPEMVRLRTQCQKKCQAYNALPVDALEERQALLRSILGKTGKEFLIEQPFQCDLGYNIEIGEGFYANHGLVILDSVAVTFGDHVLIGPNCGIYAAGHPLNVKQRNAGLEYGKSVHVGDNVWIGGGVQIVPGASIGAGSVVTRDIPAGVIAGGNPCRVIRAIDPEDLEE